MTTFRVADRYTMDPGGRFRTDGDFSGEDFRETHVLELVEAAIEDGTTVIFNFDGVTGMPTSFLEEAFGGMVRARPDWTEEQVSTALKIEAPASKKLWPFVQFANDAVAKAFRKRR